MPPHSRTFAQHPLHLDPSTWTWTCLQLGLVWSWFFHRTSSLVRRRLSPCWHHKQSTMDTVSLVRKICVSSKTSCLAVQPSECLKHTAKLESPPLQFTHKCVIVPSLKTFHFTPSRIYNRCHFVFLTPITTPPDMCFPSSTSAGFLQPVLVDAIHY